VRLKTHAMKVIRWTDEMTLTCVRGSMVGLLGTSVVIAISLGSTLNAAAVTPAEAHTLIEHGEVGINALWILTAVAPIVGALVWTIARLMRLLDKQIVEAAEERAAQAKEASEAVVALAESHRLERQETAKAEREERQKRTELMDRTMTAQTAALVENTKSLQQICDQISGAKT